VVDELYCRPDPSLEEHRPGWRSGGAHEIGGAPAEKLNGMIIIRISENY
jgi:hypothetical protein